MASVPEVGSMLVAVIVGGVFATVTGLLDSRGPGSSPSVGVASQLRIWPLSKDEPSMVAVVTDTTGPEPESKSEPWLTYGAYGAYAPYATGYTGYALGAPTAYTYRSVVPYLLAKKPTVSHNYMHVTIESLKLP